VIVLITTSVNYADYLTFALRAASTVVDRGYVVTTHDDASIGVADEMRAVPLIYDGWQADGAKLNKAGAIRYAQEIVHAKYPDAWYLLLDADCMLQVGSREIIQQNAIDESCLYGARRVDFPTIESLQANRPGSVYGNQFAGYFQLYRRHVLYPHWSHSAEACDHAFAEQFSTASVLPLTVGHLGQPRINWEGRVSAPWVHGCFRSAITSENPAEHWTHLDVSGGVVLDLGCGYNDDQARDYGWSTPAHWLACEADRIIGVDTSAADIERIIRETPGTYHCEPVSVDLVARYMPEVTHIKSDCEGAEVSLFAVPITGNVRAVAVECHNEALIAQCRRWVIDGGLKIVAEQPLSHRPDIVVITAERR
jgi:hypothetical protein